MGPQKLVNGMTVGENLVAIHNDVKHICEDMESIKKLYVTKEEFNPVRSIVYGMISLILVAVFGALITLAMTASPVK